MICFLAEVGFIFSENITILIFSILLRHNRMFLYCYNTVTKIQVLYAVEIANACITYFVFSDNLAALGKFWGHFSYGIFYILANFEDHPISRF